MVVQYLRDLVSAGNTEALDGTVTMTGRREREYAPESKLGAVGVSVQQCNVNGGDSAICAVNRQPAATHPTRWYL